MLGRVGNPSYKTPKLFSDSHLLCQLDTTYSYIYAAEKDTDAVIEAVKKGAVEVITSPLSLMQMGMIYNKVCLNYTAKKFGTESLVIVSKKDIKEMSTINETMIELKSVPKTFFMILPSVLSVSICVHLWFHPLTANPQRSSRRVIAADPAPAVKRRSLRARRGRRRPRAPGSWKERTRPRDRTGYRGNSESSHRQV